MGDNVDQSNSNKISPAERMAQVLLCLLVAAQYIEHLNFMPLTITQLLGFLLAGAFFLEKNFWKRPDPVFWYLLLFFAVFTFSTLWYLDEIPFLFQDVAIVKIFTLLQSLVLCYISFCLFTRQQTKRFVIYSIFIAAAVISILVLLGIGLTEVTGRFSFGELDQNAMAILIGLGIVTALYLATSDKWLIYRVVALISLLPMVWFLVSTGSRGGMLATGAGIVAYFIRSRKILTWFFGAMIIITLLWQVSSIDIAFFRWEKTIQIGDTANREEIFISSWEQFKERPLLGRGDVNAYIDLGAYFNSIEKGFHNELFWILNSTGVVGGFFIFWVFWKVLQNIWYDKESWCQNINMAFFVLLGLVCMNVEFHNRKIFWVLLAFLLSRTLRNDHGQEDE